MKSLFCSSLRLWDALLAEDLYPTLNLVDYICLAMLLRIRESLLDSDCKRSMTLYLLRRAQMS